MTRPTVRGNAGVTLIELLFGIVIMGMVTAGAMRLLQQQELAFSLGASRMNTLQSYRFAAETLERNIRTAGANLGAGQPFIVYADSATLSINADYTSGDFSDAFAVYVDPSADPQETGALTRARRMVIPHSTFSYPDSSYLSGPVNSSAETITFYFAPDTSTTRGEDYVLYRQVNDLAPETVARGLVKVAGQPFFTYQRVVSGDTIVPRAEWVPASSLPLRHQQPIHLSPADTGAVARIDGIRAVRVAFAAVEGSGAREQTSRVARTIRMPNAGQRALQTCGEEPLFSSGVGAVQDGGEPRILVTWSPSFDEASGEVDIVRYAIFRREVPDPDWGEPYFSIPAGQANYLYSDGDVKVGSTYQYAIAAQDCTPTMSGLRTSPEVLINP